ncbi:MAG: hypothetical protein JNG86_09310 [Verrucomicrobiaceae bacterium]|nr:hypothetical protein [Verrucomicrobiaceae bacterium]
MKLISPAADRLHTDVSEFEALPAMSRPAGVIEPAGRLERLIQWRQEHRELHQQLRIAGIRRSEKVRQVLHRNHSGPAKQRWLASIRKNPKFQACTRHIAAKEWTLRSPDGQIHTFRNLRHFIREHEALFDPADVIWKAQGQSTKITWCVAYQALARLRPGSARTLPGWQGWTWASVPSPALAS